ncbi:MAG: hypothetical protein Sapg2KO_49300 [Saprospiraceae bacterium]
MTIRSLKDTPQSEIIDCFINAFEGYFVPMPTDPAYYQKRWTEQEILFDLSFGCFDEQNQLIAFVLHALDYRSGAWYAYNAGTGVLAKHRGQGLIKQVYDFALPILKKAEAKGVYLEVITENTKAVKLYERIGFQNKRTLDCLRGTLEKEPSNPILLQRIPWARVPWERIDQSTAAWGHHQKALNGETAQFYHVLVQKKSPKKMGYFIISPDQQYLYQIGVQKDDESYWEAVVEGLAFQSQKLRAINVDNRTKASSFLSAAGLEVYLQQYEMLWTF